MTAAEQSLLRLLSDALWKGRIPETVPDEVLEEAQKQAVNGLLESGKARLAGVARFVRYTYAEQQLVRLLEDSGIPLVMLKGSAAAVYYPEPSRRSFGDLDFLVPPAFLTAACRVLEELQASQGAPGGRSGTLLEKVKQLMAFYDSVMSAYGETDFEARYPGEQFFF